MASILQHTCTNVSHKSKQVASKFLFRTSRPGKSTFFHGRVRSIKTMAAATVDHQVNTPVADEPQEVVAPKLSNGSHSASQVESREPD